jgi:hypothetical protein
MFRPPTADNFRQPQNLRTNAARYTESVLNCDKLHNTLYVSSSATDPWRCLQLVTETWRSLRTMYCAASWKQMYVYRLCNLFCEQASILRTKGSHTAFCLITRVNFRAARKNGTKGVRPYESATWRFKTTFKMGKPTWSFIFLVNLSAQITMK